MIRRTFLQSMAAMFAAVKVLPQTPAPAVIAEQVDTSAEHIESACCIGGAMLDIPQADCKWLGGNWVGESRQNQRRPQTWQ